MSNLENTILSSGRLVASYLDVVNRAVHRHANCPPYRKILDLSERVIGDRPMNLLIDDATPGQEDHQHTLRFHAGKFEYLRRGRSDDPRAIQLELAKKNLHEVVDAPHRFVESPNRLPLDWLRSRLEAE